MSQSMYGDPSYANKIAQANGYKASMRVPAEMTLTIPNIQTSNHNWAGVYEPYNATTIIGSLYPTMPVPPPPPHSIFAEFLEVFVDIVAMIAVPEILGLTQGLVDEALGAAIGALVGDIGDQLIAISFGEQHGFSFKSAIDSFVVGAVTGAVSYELGISPTLTQSKSVVKPSALGSAAGQYLKTSHFNVV